MWNHYYNFNGVESRPITNQVGGNIKKWDRMKILLKKNYKNKIILDIGCRTVSFQIRLLKWEQKKFMELISINQESKEQNLPKNFKY